MRAEIRNIRARRMWADGFIKIYFLRKLVNWKWVKKTVMSRTTVIKFRERKTTEAKKSLHCCEQKRRGSGPEIILEKARGLDLTAKAQRISEP